MHTTARRSLIVYALAALGCLITAPAFATVVEYNAVAAIADEWAQHSGGHAFYLKGLFDPSDSSAERKYLFDGTPTFRVDDGGTLGNVEDDTIVFFGSIMGAVDEDITFDFEVEFARLDPDDVPGGTPKLELKDEAYIDEGLDPGIDPSTWSFWLLTEGSLFGTGVLDGGVISLDHRRMNGDLAPAFALGLGASGKNIDYGFSGWIDWETMEQPNDNDFEFRRKGHGDININLEEIPMPIPGTTALLVAGLAGVGWSRRRRTNLSE